LSFASDNKPGHRQIKEKEAHSLFIRQLLLWQYIFSKRGLLAADRRTELLAALKKGLQSPLTLPLQCKGL
jgi:hypothetical protein